MTLSPKGRRKRLQRLVVYYEARARVQELDFRGSTKAREQATQNSLEMANSVREVIKNAPLCKYCGKPVYPPVDISRNDIHFSSLPRQYCNTTCSNRHRFSPPPGRNREVRRLRKKGHTLQHIGDIMEISRERVRQILAQRKVK